MVNISVAGKDDYLQLWSIFQEIIAGEDSYVYPANSTQDDFVNYWFAEKNRVYVAKENNVILGSYLLRENHVGLGSHIANASYIVSRNARGKGIGEMLCNHSIETAKLANFYALQFNIVVSTNIAAIKLWQKCGFKIIGTSPESFQHKEKGLVDSYIMYRKL